MVAEKELLEEISAGESKISSLLKELISAKTVNPPGREYLAARIIKRELKARGIKFRTYAKERGRTNVIARIGRGNPKLCIACHSDVVPAGEGWKTDPFRAVEKHGRIYGRGAEDDKGPLAATLFLMLAMKKYEKEMRGTLTAVFAADEERGSKLGAAFLLNEKKLNSDYAIIPDIGSGMREITIGEKGIMRVRVESVGKQAHGSRPKKGVNAITNMAEFLRKLGKWNMKYKKMRYFGKPTLNVGTIKGGASFNTVPADCVVEFDIRYLPCQNPEKMLRKLERFAKSVEKKNPKAKFKIEIEENQPPFLLKKTHPLVHSLIKNTEAIGKKTPRVITESGTTMAKKFAAKGIFAVGFCPGAKKLHKSNEFIELRQLTQFAEITALACRDLLF